MPKVILSHDDLESKRKEFYTYHNTFIEELLSYPGISGDLSEVVDWWRRAFEHSLTDGQMNRGFSAYLTAVTLAEQGGKLTDDFKRSAAALGYALEVLRESFLIEEDIVNKSETRRGRPCWYRVDGVSMMAINDAGVMESFAHELIKFHCEANKNYEKILEIYEDSQLKALAGYTADVLFESKRSTTFLDECKFSRYRKIAEFKTVYPNIYCPVLAGMLLAGEDNENKIEECGKILVALGEYLQARDDCCSDATKTGESIMNGKCSWQLVKALELVNKTQRKVLEENYGKASSECVNRVTAVFKDLNIWDEFKAYEKKALIEFHDMINASSVGETVSTLLQTILKLSK
ncbi:unnamed protein product [Notodromas monacha]|uniref:Uncharacterized protein n=1 Tax=Notodromas monacha TaxID=399045 RepID=A0A7R9BX58_9CRUS|nr:unnamed protein product [Notodromas monacha]CAG0921853.1 unnamed protein product [Notodromas monacha]